MAGIETGSTPRPNILADANAGNRKILYEEVEQVTALRATLDAQYRGARQPALPDLFTRAFASKGASNLELPAPPLPASFPRHPEPRQVQLELKALLRRRDAEPDQLGSAGRDQDGDAHELFTLLARISRNYEDLQNRVALAMRN